MREALEKSQLSLLQAEESHAAATKQAVERIQTEYNQTIANLRAEIDALQQRMTAMRATSPGTPPVSPRSSRSNNSMIIDRDREMTALHAAHNAKVSEMENLVANLKEENAGLKEIIQNNR